MEASREDDYLTLAQKAALKCEMPCRRGKLLSLFKSNGARILNEDITIKGKKKPWSLGRYLQLLKKAPHNTKIGIGYVPNDCDDLESSDQVRHTYIF